MNLNRVPRADLLLLRSPDNEVVRATQWGVGTRAAIAVLLVALYALSPGPVWWFLNRAGFVNGPVRACIPVIYWPLQRVIEAVPAIEHFYRWYTELFVVRG